MPETIADGRYQVRRFLGEGAKKRVYLAFDTRLDREVAVAIIKADGLDEAGRTRVQREAQAMGRLGDHPHVVTVYDIGEENTQPFIVSQYMAGGGLEDRLAAADGRRLDVGEAIGVAIQISRALEHAHQSGVVHRDIKPGNVWLAADGNAQLGDFGLALSLDRSRLTQDGMMVGTVVYMPPEQALSGEVTALSDLYSLGALIYEMVTGRPPFVGDDSVAVISQHLNTPPVAPSWHCPGLPMALERVIMRLLAKDPSERYQSAAALRDALESIGSVDTDAPSKTGGGRANPLEGLAEGVFVGRDKELDELRSGLDDSLSGRGRILLLVGEPGIGKTRTSEELTTYARVRGGQVLWGRCYEGEGAPAYWPWVQIIRSYVHDHEPNELLSHMGAGAADIADVVSEVRQSLPGLAPAPALGAEEARFRLFDSVTTFLKNASAQKPLVLVLDDLHWADKPTLLLLQFLAREMGHARLLVLGTYRDVELRRQHPLSETLAELARLETTKRVLLRGLLKRDVARFIEASANIEAPESLVEGVYRETEGNPFFVHEVVRLLAEDGRLEQPESVSSWSVTIPQGVREVIGRRLNKLSDDCNQALTTASAAGREFEVAVVERSSELSPERILEVIEEAEAARVIDRLEGRSDRYRFSHALIQETLYEELGTSRRVKLHRKMAGVIESLHATSIEAHLSELAHHALEGAHGGGDAEKAIEYARRAAEQAARRLAYEESVKNYEHARQALDLLPEPDPAMHCDLLIALAVQLVQAGDIERSRAVGHEAVELADRLGDPLRRASAAIRATFMLEPGIIHDDAIALLQRAIDGMPSDDTQLHVELLSQMALVQQLSLTRATIVRAAPFVHEAVAMARRLGDPGVLFQALLGTLFTVWGPADLAKRKEINRECVEVAARSGNRTDQFRAQEMAVWSAQEAGDAEALAAAGPVLRRIAAELRLPGFAGWVRGFDAMEAWMDGRLDDAERLATESLQLAQGSVGEVAVWAYSAHLMTIRLEQGRAMEIAEGTRAAVEKYPAVPVWRAVLAASYASDGREEEARSEFEVLAARDFEDVLRDPNYLITLSLISDVCTELGDEARAEILSEMLRPYSDRFTYTQAGPTITGSIMRSLGDLAATCGRIDEAADFFEAAIARNREVGVKPAVPRTQYHYARALAGSGEAHRRDKAIELVNEALDLATEYGMKFVVERCLALKLQLQGVTSSDMTASILAVADSVEGHRPDMAPHAAPDGTVTLMLSDMVNFTAMTERLGDLRARDVVREHNRLIREQIAANQGYEVDTAGDGFLVAFKSARFGLACAIAIQRALAARNAEAGEPIEVRIGLHTGEALKDADKFFGRTVILAARIGAQAKGGEILVSSLIKELSASVGDVSFGELREVQLKGIAEPQRVVEVRWR